MTRERALTGFLSVLTITSLLTAAGCQSGGPGAAPPQSPSGSAVEQQKPAAVLDVPAGPPTPAPQPAPASPEDQVSLASNAEKSGGTVLPPQPKDTKGKTAAADKPKIEIQSPYTEANPTLLGLTLKTAASEITGKFGKPKEQFVMEDDADPVTVYDYTDFLVGFNSRNELHFVDVRSADVNPGLNGLKLGDPVSSVYEALGKPDPTRAMS
ncbi:hypothetical protein PM3016_1967 [Paenibacillus mucilaginosus 3016]|uniref:Lipoprotein n=1 Tax=Paenibacillus mucilaginosus 3016 TaxID=1116391 RepID=H6NA25_9BACL|nr:hypothetical protein [Paenibacillus mucilaginosus]AFC28869.1 hypothetical protein PM3016_1967 [Paenibacillus mucilaginosus 3016]